MTSRLKVAVSVGIVALVLGIVIPSVAATSHRAPSNPTTGPGGVAVAPVAPAPSGAGSTGRGVAVPGRGTAIAQPAPVGKAGPPVGRYPGIPCPVETGIPCGPYPVLPGNANTVTVTGTATVNSQPDEAVIGLGVQTQASDANDALRENATRMAAVMKALANLGIAKADITTSSFSLYPNYNNGGAPSGYQADDEISVTVHDLSKVGSVIDSAVHAGANLTNGISFQLSNQNQGLDNALKAAVTDAKSKAQALATAAGAKLGPVVSINESSEGYQPPVYAAAASGGAPTPVNPPNVQTQVSVTTVWSISK